MSDDKPSDDDLGALEAIDKANQSASKGPMSALLTPSFEILGDKLENFTRRIFEGKQKNNKAHAEAVREKIDGKEREPSGIALANLQAWEEPAGNYSNEDPEAALWRGILEEILTGKRNLEDIIEVAKKLDERDVLWIENNHAALARGRVLPKKETNTYEFEKLQKTGVVKTVSSLNYGAFANFMLFPIFIMALYLLWFAWETGGGKYALPANLILNDFLAFVALVTAVMSVMYFMLQVRKQGLYIHQHHFTPLGGELFRLIKKYKE